MTAYGTQPYEEDGQRGGAQEYGPVESAAMLGAVREDVRQTLRAGWIDPALDAAASSPVFFTAAWSAIRPNVGKSFLLLARSLRAEAVESLRSSVDIADLRKRLEGELSDEELGRIEESARAAFQVMPKVEIVTHALHRVIRRERLPGTGREEAPVRRGVPEWQRWMSFQPAGEPVRALLDEAAAVIGVPTSLTPLRLFGRWPRALGSIWEELRPISRTEAWLATIARVRRLLLARIASLPHPMELQWAALKARGFAEEDRVGLADTLAAHDATMAAQTSVAAFAWVAVGAPEVGNEG
jgi:hypothetical protein